MIFAQNHHNHYQIHNTGAVLSSFGLSASSNGGPTVQSAVGTYCTGIFFVIVIVIVVVAVVVFIVIVIVIVIDQGLPGSDSLHRDRDHHLDQHLATPQATNSSS